MNALASTCPCTSTTHLPADGTPADHPFYSTILPDFWTFSTFLDHEPDETCFLSTLEWVVPGLYSSPVTVDPATISEGRQADTHLDTEEGNAAGLSLSLVGFGSLYGSWFLFIQRTVSHWTSFCQPLLCKNRLPHCAALTALQRFKPQVLSR